MNIFGYDIQEGVVFIIHIIATIGGAVVGWFVCDPITRATYRLSMRAATPGALLFCTKAIGAASLAAAVWFLMPEGGGGGGPGLGPGAGGLPSKGGDKGGEKSGDPVKDAKIDVKKDKIDPKSTKPLDPVEIEVISDTLYKQLLEKDDKERWYVIQKKPYSLDELDAYLKANRTRIEVTPVLTKHSIRLGQAELIELTKKYNVKTLQYKIE